MQSLRDTVPNFLLFFSISNESTGETLLFRLSDYYQLPTSNYLCPVYVTQITDKKKFC